jgi:hypothetical protein
MMGSLSHLPKTNIYIYIWFPENITKNAYPTTKEQAIRKIPHFKTNFRLINLNTQVLSFHW